MGRIGSGAATVVNRVFESVSVDERCLDAALAVFQLSQRHSAGRSRGGMLRLALAGQVRSHGMRIYS